MASHTCIARLLWSFHHAAKIALTHVYTAAKVEAIEDFGNNSDPKTNFDNSSDPRTDFGNGSEPKTGFGNTLDPKTDFGIPGQTLAIVWIAKQTEAMLCGLPTGFRRVGCSRCQATS